MTRIGYIFATLLAAIGLAGTGTTGATNADPTRGLPIMPEPVDNPTTTKKAALGHQLFLDPRLSGSGEMSCQSCHYHHLGWTDGKPFSQKDDGGTNNRNTPSLYNVGHQTAWYWDGRAMTLEDQVLAAWRSQIGADPEEATARVNEVSGYAAQFEEIFGGPATPDRIVKALAAYLRTVVSDSSPWDRYEAGDAAAVGPDAIEGYRLFTGKAGCATCHTPPYFGNSTFYNIGLEHGKEVPDLGRYKVTGEESDRSAFKTPSLRSVARTAPYFHDASAATLEDAVRYMAAGGGEDPSKSPLLTDRGLTDDEIGKLLAFLHSLTSEEPWEPPSLP